jgi:NADH:ubiquinone oxidoreductase subunit K
MFIPEFLFALSFFLFVIGCCGVVSTQDSLIFMLLSIEIILLSACFVFVLSSILFVSMFGQVFALIILAIAAAESAIGLVLFILFYKQNQTMSYLFLNILKR